MKRPTSITLRGATAPFVAAVCAIVFANDLYRTWEGRSDALEAARREATNIAWSGAQNAADAIQLADAALIGVVERAEVGAAAPGELERLQRLMAVRVGTEPLLHGLTLLDETGTVVASGLPLSHPVNLADRAYFQFHRTHRDRGPYIGTAVRSKISGRWVLTVSRRVEDAHGEFAGAAVATIDLAYFARYYDLFDLGHDGAIGLIRADGLLLVRHPMVEANIGVSLSDTPLFRDLLPKAPSGSQEETSPLDGVDRLLSYRRVEGYPLVIAAALGKNEQLASWRMRTRNNLLATTVAVLLLAGVAHLLSRQSRLRADFQQANQSVASGRLSLQTLIDCVPDYLWIKDTEGRFVVANASLARGSGFAATSEMIGLTDFDIHAPDLARDFRAMEEQVLRTGEPMLDREEAIVDASGASRWLLSTKVPLRNSSNDICGLVGIARDITGRVAAEAARREGEYRLQSILDSIVDDAVYMLDPDGNVASWNPGAQRIKGYRPDEIVGRNFALFFTPEDVAAGAPARVLATARENGRFAFEGTRVRKDGSRFVARVAIYAIRGEDGNLIGFAKLTHDITERTRIAQEQREAEARERLAVEQTNARLDTLSRHLARARDEAVRANLAKSRFLTGITHELRTPLNGILGYAQLLQLEGGLTPMQAARVDAMLGAGKHLLGMINAVLDLSQVEGDRLELRPADIDLLQLAGECVDVVRPAAAAKQLAVGVVSAPDAPTRLVADPTRLRQVVVNLLGNAVKFTAAGAVQVRLLRAQDGRNVRLEVADTGPGIPAARRDRLFREFERLDADALATVEGAGLGLAITARLIQHMGGQIGYADNPGGGSIFWAELPAADDSGAAAPDSVAPDLVAPDVVAPDVVAPVVAAAARRLRVLVVDDVAMNRDIASAFLRIGGHEVVCVDGGAAAVAAVARGAFDVVLMDVRMPGVDGLEATRRIRALSPPRGAVPVLAVTAQAFAEQIEKCREAGMNDHVSKPYQQAALLAAVEAIAGVAPASIAGIAEPDVPLLDDAVFEATAGFLAPVDLQRHLQTLIARSEALLDALRQPDAPLRGGELAQAAHALAGSAGMFGFAQVATVARRFEHAAESGAPDTMAVGADLAAATEATIAAMRERSFATLAVAAGRVA